MDNHCESVKIYYHIFIKLKTKDMTKEEIRKEWCMMKGFNFIDFETLTEAEEYILFLESKIEAQQNKVEERELDNLSDEISKRMFKGKRRGFKL